MGLQILPTSRFTFRTGMRRKMFWSWRRVTDLAPSDPSVMWLCRTRTLMDGTSRRPFVAGERKGRGNAWWRTRLRQGQILQPQHMGSHLNRSPTSSILGDSSWQRTTTGQRWSTTFGENVRSGHTYLGCWAGRVQMTWTWGVFTWRWCWWLFFKGQRRG